MNLFNPVELKLKGIVKMRLIVCTLLFLVASVSGKTIRKVVYSEGPTLDDKISSSSSLEEIPPREEWFRVRGDHHVPQAIAHQTDVVTLPSNSKTPKFLSNVFPSHLEEDISRERERQRSQNGNTRNQMHVTVQHRGRVGFQHHQDQDESRRGVFARRGDEDEEWEEITKAPPLSKMKKKGGQVQNGYQQIRHEDGENGQGRIEILSRPQQPREPGEEQEFTDVDVTRTRHNEPTASQRDREGASVEEDRDVDYEYDGVSSSRTANNGRRAEALSLNSGQQRRVVVVKSSTGMNNVISNIRETEHDYDDNDDGPPPHDQVARMARYIVHNSNWTTMATVSTIDSVKGYPFVNIFSVSDGTNGNSSGIPYMYLTPLDMSAKDLERDSRASLTMSLAQSEYCTQQQYDPEDPRCAKVILSGRVVPVTNKAELQFAKNAVYTKHPDMQTWPKDHGWFFAKLDISNIIVLDYFGGAKTVTVDDYFNL